MKMLDRRIAEELGHLEPPPPYARTEELEAHFLASLPDITAGLAGLFARPTPRISKERVAQVARRLRRFLSAAKPYLLALGALAGQLDLSRSKYALLEGLIRVQLAGVGVRVPPSEDAWSFLLKLAKKRARADRRLARFKGYLEVKDSLLVFSAYLVWSVPSQALEEALTEWSRSGDAKRSAQFVVQLPTLVRQFRTDPPRRLTSATVFDLGNEYKLSSGFFEQRVRLIVYLARIAERKPLSWATMQKWPLKDLLDAAAARPELVPIVAKINRHVRNALAHGTPEVRPDSLEVVFDDHGKAVRWTIKEFFDNTRGLTIAVCGLAEFEVLMQFEQVLRSVTTLWRSQNTGATASSATGMP
jgi:hypothetical protein